LKLRHQNKKFFNFKEILVKHRIHAASAFNSKGNDNKVDNLLLSHGLKTRADQINTKITTPPMNKMHLKN
jgi:hypothetical protein